jgi:hypothetical protein
MADDIPRLSFQIKDLPTKSVTLYPSRAHVVREICDVVLKPGQNEIQIHGLSSSVDENSVQIDGRGGASITDLTLELVPNSEDFDETYPKDTDSSDSESDEDEEIAEIPAVRLLTDQISNLDLKINEALEQQLSAERRLKTLNQHAESINSEKVDHDELTKALRTYENERAYLFKANVRASEELKSLRKIKAKREAERKKAGKEEEKRKEKLKKEKTKLLQKKIRAKHERFREAQRIELERRKFWPAKVYQINLRLESTIDTPGSSRRNSIDGVTLSGIDNTTSEKSKGDAIGSSDRTVSLSLSYVTNSAFWSPRYDLSISSLQKTASIVYRAELSNGTSETWKDAKVILSTSQTSYSGLDDKVPTLTPWHVKLAKYEQVNGGLLSYEESNGPRHAQAIAQSNMKKSMKNAHGFPSRGGGLFGSTAPQQAIQTQQQMQQMQLLVTPQQQTSSLFGNVQQQQNIGGLFASAPPPPPPAAQPSGGFGAFGASGGNQKELSRKRSGLLGGGLFGSRAEEAPAPGEFDPSTAWEGGGADADGLDFEESVWEDSGLTASYEIPGTRTLTPSTLARRHKIASLQATNIHLSYVAVPKLRSAAFLRAKVRNPSASVTLLKGTAGVTLDGSFLGNMPLPRVSPNQVFSLPLGVDPAIHINYPKPTVHRSTQGFLNKESAHMFNRSVWLTNTKSTPVELLVLDQIPVSQDERLKVEILQPRSLYKEGDSVRAGEAAKEGASGTTAVSQQNGSWGKAVATLKKGGEMTWTVNLEKGQACLLKMEYEARLPQGDNIVSA